jgi:hypothetical protein
MVQQVSGIHTKGQTVATVARGAQAATTGSSEWTTATTARAASTTTAAARTSTARLGSVRSTPLWSETKRFCQAQVEREMGRASEKVDGNRNVGRSGIGNIVTNSRWR